MIYLDTLEWLARAEALIGSLWPVTLGSTAESQASGDWSAPDVRSSVVDAELQASRFSHLLAQAISGQQVK